MHPDQVEAAERIAEALGGALGTEVRVRPRGTGYRVELAFADLDEALALARRAAPPRRRLTLARLLRSARAISSVG